MVAYSRGGLIEGRGLNRGFTVYHNMIDIKFYQRQWWELTKIIFHRVSFVCLFKPPHPHLSRLVTINLYLLTPFNHPLRNNLNKNKLEFQYRSCSARTFRNPYIGNMSIWTYLCSCSQYLIGNWKKNTFILCIYNFCKVIKEMYSFLSCNTAAHTFTIAHSF